jgi:NADH:ubiquinone oxidoreductase subunit
MQKRTSTDRKSSSPSCVSTLLSHLAVGIISFQLGSVSHFAHNSTISPDHGNLNDMLSSTFQGGDRNGPGSVGECCKCPSDAEQEERLRQLNGNNNNNNNNNKDGEVQTDDEDVGSSSSTANIFDNATVDTSLTASMNKMFVGAARVSRDSFITNFDLGVPWDMHHYYEDILLLYSDIDAFPTTTRTMTKTTTTQSDGKQEFPNVYYKSATDATQQCDTLKVILIDKEIGQCLALVPQWESYIVYKYLRYKDEKYKFMRKLPTISKTYPLRHVSRFHSEKKGGSDRDARIPTMSQLKRYLPMLSDYINNLDNVLDTLRPLLEEMMIRYKKINGLDLTDNHIGRKRRRRVKDHYAVVVMVCNYGQSELFLNFICTAKSRGLDISRILLFATDMEMYDLARTIPDISVFQVGDAFGVIPKTAARVYGDKVFTGMMFSKIYCVHLVNLLGYDVLFQDVDIVWYKNPVEYFENSARSGNYDFYFQDGMFLFIIYLFIFDYRIL